MPWPCADREPERALAVRESGTRMHLGRARIGNPSAPLAARESAARPSSASSETEIRLRGNRSSTPCPAKTERFQNRPPENVRPLSRQGGNSRSQCPLPPGVTYTSDVKREPPVLVARCRGMRVEAGITPATGQSTEVAAVLRGPVTLGVRGAALLSRPRETWARALGLPSGGSGLRTHDSLRPVTGSRIVTSPGSGAVADGVMKLTCSAISNTRRQGGVQPMSLAPAAR